MIDDYNFSKYEISMSDHVVSPYRCPRPIFTWVSSRSEWSNYETNDITSAFFIKTIHQECCQRNRLRHDLCGPKKCWSPPCLWHLLFTDPRSAGPILLLFKSNFSTRMIYQGELNRLEDNGTTRVLSPPIFILCGRFSKKNIVSN